MSHAQLSKLIIGVLGHFRVGEFKNEVIPCFQELTWQTVMHEIKKSKVSLTIKNIKAFIIKNLENRKVDSLRVIYLKLSVVDIALHSSRRVWNAYKMLGPGKGRMDLDNLSDMMRQGFRLHNIECELQSHKFGEIVWLSVVEKQLKRKGGVVWKSPIHCAYFMDTKYIFITGSVNDKLLNGISHAFRYKKIKKLRLSGRDVKSLFSLLKKKESGTPSAVEYTLQSPKVTRYGIDYTQHKNRLAFTESCFNDDSVRLETVTFLSSKGSCKVHGYESLKMRDSLKLLSSNTFSSMKKMFQELAIDPENCDDIKNLMQKGENLIVLDNSED